MVFHANVNKKKTGVAILTSGNIDFKTYNVTRNRKGYCILKNSSI